MSSFTHGARERRRALPARRRLRGIVGVVLALLLAGVPAKALASVNHNQSESVAWANARAAERWAVDVDNSYGVQCVDLIKAYYQYLVGYSVRGNAIDYTNDNGANRLPSGWQRVYSQPQPGDVVVWNRSGRAHV